MTQEQCSRDYIGQYLIMGTGEDPPSFRDNKLDLGLFLDRTDGPPCLLIAYKEMLKVLTCRC